MQKPDTIRAGVPAVAAKDVASDAAVANTTEDTGGGRHQELEKRNDHDINFRLIL